MTKVEPIKLPLSSGAYSNSKVINTGDGVFYTGMTLKDAELIGRDTCFFRRDFYNLDKNGDRVLTNDEIMSERERQVHEYTNDILLGVLFALEELFSYVNESRGRIGLLFAAVFTGLAVVSGIKKKKMEVENEHLRQQLLV